MRDILSGAELPNPSWLSTQQLKRGRGHEAPAKAQGVANSERERVWERDGAAVALPRFAFSLWRDLLGPQI